MSDEPDWGDIDSLPKPKDGIPKWVWCCGCGCLIPIVLMIALAGFGFKFVKEGRDAEQAWGHVENVLPYDDRLEGWNLEWGRPLFFGWEMYVWVQDIELGEDEKPREPILFATLMVAPADHIDELLSTGEGSGEAETEQFEIVVQGREIQGTRSQTEDADAPFPFMPDPEDGASAVLDLSEKDGDKARVLLIVRQGSSDPITDEEIQEFLAPFHVGPDR